MTRKQVATEKFNQVVGMYNKYGIQIKSGRKDYATKRILGNIAIATL